MKILIKRMVRFFFILIVVFVLADPVAGQNVLHSENPERFIPVWSYHPGDDSLWSRPEYREVGWEPVVITEFFDGRLPAQGWSGVGWFRARIQVDESAVGVPFAYVLAVRGAAEFYLDGELVDARGRVGSSAGNEISVIHHAPTMRPGVLVFDTVGDHVLAVRVSNFNMREGYRLGGAVGGFSLRFGRPDKAVRIARSTVRRLTADQFLFTGIPAAFALVFFLLYAFHRDEMAHVLFAVLCSSVALGVFLDVQSELTYDGEDFIVIRMLLHSLIAVSAVVALPTTYRMFEQNFPIHSWALTVAGAGFAVWGWLDPFGVFPALPIFSLVVVIELARTTVMAVLKKRKRAWIVALGLLVLTVGVAYDNLLDLDLLFPIASINNGYYYGITALEISMAVFLAASFTQTNRRLEHKLVEVEKLHERSIEHEREARKNEIERVRLEADNQLKSLQLKNAQQLHESYRSLEDALEQLKSAQAGLVHSEKMASLGKLASGIAHDIKNPLNFISNFATMSIDMATELKGELLAEGKSRDSEMLVIVDTIIGNARRISEHGKKAAGVVKSLMEHSKTSSGQRRKVDLNALIDNYVRLSYRAMKAMRGDEIEVKIESDYDPEVGSQEIIPETFSRALVNLLDNAFDAAIEGHGGSEHVPVVKVSTTKLNDSVFIRIRDNGPGVPPELRERIFEPFFTTKPAGSGSGLGLSLAHEIIVEGHNGTLGLEHLYDRETGFYISIPSITESTEEIGAEWPERF